MQVNTLLNPKRLRALGAAAVLAAAVPAGAADHQEAPGTKADPAADLADVYAWHDSDANALVVAFTFDGLVMPARQEPTLEDGVLYTVNIDNDGDFVADIPVQVRFIRLFGQKLMVVQNLPGAPRVFFAPVERKVKVGKDCMVFAGLREDPFFFDLQGFRTTLQTGTLSFDGNRDTFAGLNVTAVVLEMKLDEALDSGSALNVWATTARK